MIMDRLSVSSYTRVTNFKKYSGFVAHSTWLYNRCDQNRYAKLGEHFQYPIKQKLMWPQWLTRYAALLQF